MASTGKAAGVDPRAFKIVDGKLYLNWNKDSAELFEAGAGDYIQQADRHWEQLTQKP